MSDMIQEFDVTFSVRSPEWHGKANVRTREEMLTEVRTNILPVHYVELTLQGVAESGEVVQFPDKKLICADTSLLPVASFREVHPPALVPLATPGNVFTALQNSVQFEAVESAFSRLGLPFADRLETAGSLCNLAKFYFSVGVEDLNFIGPDGQPIEGFLNFLNAANGENCAAMILEQFRVVCHNTYMATLNGNGAVKLFGKHTSNGIPDFLDSIGKGIEALAIENKRLAGSVFPRLAETSVSRDRAINIVDGYSFARAIADNEKLSGSVEITAQAEKATEEIVSLAWNGSGNRGGDLYQLFQGATDFWSNGGGVGSEKVGLTKRISRSRWGSAATHKAEFLNYLSSDFSEAEKIGKVARTNRALRLATSVN